MSAAHARGRRALLRAAAALPAVGALGACSFFDDLFFTDKPKVPGKRIALNATQRGLEVDPGYKPTIAVPKPVAVADWPQPGGVVSHEGGHLALPDRIARAWSSGIGEGGGLRAKITAQPVIAAGRVYTMDSDGLITAFDVRAGNRIWRFDTQAEDDRSSNVGGGLSVDGGMLYASTGRGEVMALDAATGKLKWRAPLGTAARAAPTVAESKLFVPTLADQLAAFSTADGKRLWTYQALNATTTVLGLPSPAFADGLVIAGFGSGDVVALRASTGGVSWSDSLASARGRNSLVDLSAVRGMPVVAGGTVYATGLGGLMLALDLRSGRRLWERDIGSSETPWVAGDWIFVVSTEQVAACLSRLDGRVAWVTQLPRWNDVEHERDPIVWSGPVLAGDRLLLGGSNDRAMAISPYTGAILGDLELPEKASLAPVVAGETAYFVTDDGALLALR